jgi:hypothetical protein
MPLLTSYLSGRHVTLVVSIAVQQPMIYGFINPCLNQHCWIFLNNTRLSANAVDNHLVTITCSQSVIQIACRLVCAAHPCVRHKSAVAHMLSAPSFIDVTLCTVYSWLLTCQKVCHLVWVFVRDAKMACLQCNIRHHLEESTTDVSFGQITITYA